MFIINNDTINATMNVFSETHQMIFQAKWADISVYDSVFVDNKHTLILNTYNNNQFYIKYHR